MIAICPRVVLSNATLVQRHLLNAKAKAGFPQLRWISTAHRLVWFLNTSFSETYYNQKAHMREFFYQILNKRQKKPSYSSTSGLSVSRNQPITFLPQCRLITQFACRGHSIFYPTPLSTLLLEEIRGYKY